MRASESLLPNLKSPGSVVLQSQIEEIGSWRTGIRMEPARWPAASRMACRGTSNGREAIGSRLATARAFGFPVLISSREGAYRLWDMGLFGDQFAGALPVPLDGRSDGRPNRI
jgi:hypothetical protein